MNLDVLRRQLPPYDRLDDAGLAELARGLDPVRRVALAVVLDAEADAAWFPKRSRADAVIAQIETSSETLQALRAITLQGAQPRALSPAERNRQGDSEAGLVRATARAIAVHARALMSGEARIGALAGMTDFGKAVAFASLMSPGRSRADNELHLSALNTLVPASPMNPELFRALKSFFPEFHKAPDATRAHALQQRVGESLAAEVGDEQFRFSGWQALTHAQALVAPDDVKTRPQDEGRAHQRRFYIAAHDLPETKLFADRMAQRFEQHLMDAPEGETWLYSKGVRDWPKLSEHQRVMVIGRLLSDAAQLMDVPVPELHLADFKALGKHSDNRGFQRAKAGEPGASEIWLNNAPPHSVLDSFDTAVMVALHEFTHCHQEVLRKCPSHAELAAMPPSERAEVRHSWPETPENKAMVSLIRANGQHYIPGSEDKPAYAMQPVEREAFATQHDTVPRVLRLFSAIAYRDDPAYVVSAVARVLPVLEDIALIADRPDLTQAVDSLRSRVDVLPAQGGRPVSPAMARTLVRDLAAASDACEESLAALRREWTSADAVFADSFTGSFARVRPVIDTLRLGIAPRAEAAMPEQALGGAPNVDMRGHRYHP